MQLFNIVVLITLLITTAVAQHATIGSPADGTSVTVGSNLDVVINRPVRFPCHNLANELSSCMIQRTLTGSQDVSVAIGLQSCPTQPCFAPDASLGTLLTFGPYTPDDSLQPPSQTVTVTIPATAQKGRAQLAVAHFALIGVCHLLTSK
jgi:Nis1 family